MRCALVEFDSLSADEQTQAGAMFQELFFCHQAVFNRVREGAYSEQYWQEQRESVRAQLRSPGVKQWWRRAHRLFNSDFVNEVTDNIGPN